MIELILTVCALNAPSQSDEQRLQFASAELLMQCMISGAALDRRVVGPASGGARYAVAMRFPWRREDLNNESERRATTRGAEPVATRRSEGSPMRLIEGALALAIAFFPICAADAQDAMRGLHLTSPDMTMAEMTRAEVEAALKAASGRRGADFSGKRLSGLDLSGLDLSGANLRAARLNHANLSHAKLDGALSRQISIVDFRR